MTRPADAPVPTFDDIRRAADRIRGHAVKTPLVRNDVLDARVGARVFVKPECLQRTGSFKFRGAFNKLSQTSPSERKHGVVAYSSGNHAQGVAEAAGVLAMHCTIFVPADAPQNKLARVHRAGAETVAYDRWRDNREVLAERLAAERGAVLVPPYEDPDVIAGQGTTGLEIAESLSDEAIDEPATVVIPCGGGGLAAGCALALSGMRPGDRVIIAEPVGFDDTARSLAAGRRLSTTDGHRSLCDALLVPTPGELTFSINRELVEGGASVTDNEVLAAMAFAFREFKLALEPSGASALAAVLAGKAGMDSEVVVVVATGGNVDDAVMKRALDETS